MTPMAVHHTGTNDSAWDGPAAEGRLKIDAGEAYYKSAFAWQDPDGDAETKAAYRFIHHFVSEDGTVGEASTVACSTGIGVLNGGRGGTTIPAGDRQGVYNHLAAHLKDADLEPPDLRATPPPAREERSFALRELRVEGQDTARKIVGYAAVFDVLSVPLWGFKERIRPGAFKKTIGEADVRALWNHDSNLVLGRTKSGTLALAEDEVGLRIEITPPDAQWARDHMATIERGDVDQMSFGFNTVRDKWYTDAGETIRDVEEVHLFDVSPVTFPAYPQTTVQVRQLLGVDYKTFDQVLERLERGQANQGDLRLLDQAVRNIQRSLQPTAPAPAGHPVDTVQPQSAQIAVQHALRRRRLDLERIR